jgi:hypothetical protein
MGTCSDQKLNSHFAVLVLVVLLDDTLDSCREMTCWVSRLLWTELKRDSSSKLWKVLNGV